MALANTFRVAIFDEFLDAFARIPRAQQKKVNRFVRKFRSDPTNPSINYEQISDFADKNLRTVRVDQAYRAVVLKPSKGNVYVLLWIDQHDAAMAWARHKRCTIHPDTGSLQVLTQAEAPPPPRAAPAPGHPSAASAQPLQSTASAQPLQSAASAQPLQSAASAQPLQSTAPARPLQSTASAQPLQSAASAQPLQSAASASPLFERFSEKILSSLSIPLELLPEVRALTSLDQLDEAVNRFPPDVYEALFFLASGESPEAVRQALGIEAVSEVDPEDFEAALDKESTRRRFALVTDDQALEAMLDAPLEKWRVFLHPSQRRMVRADYRGPARVLGGAGTGKTVVAMHRARHLATEVFNGENDRLLFTTFTNNLARDIQANLSKMCPPDVLRRIEVVHLDKWVADFLKRHGYGYRLVYWPGPPLNELWEEAVASGPAGFTNQFFREEWDYVVQPQGCVRYEDYRNVPRAGRGVRLSRAQRKAIWPVFETYRDRLEARGLRESVDAMRDASNLLARSSEQARYRAILVDEAQDMSTVAFQLLRRIIPTEHPNDLFIVGDGHQRIYRRKVVLRQAGVNIVGRSRKLYINYRTTDEIRRYAVALLRDVSIDDLDGGEDSNSRYKSLVHGEAPDIRRYPCFLDEVKGIIGFIQEADARQTCLITRTHNMLEQYEAALGEAGIETLRLSRNRAEDHEAPGLRLATMHRVKGLEFDRLVIAGVNEGVVPLNVGELASEDRAVREEAEKRERALFYVAATRARREVLISSFGKASPWL